MALTRLRPWRVFLALVVVSILAAAAYRHHVERSNAALLAARFKYMADRKSTMLIRGIALYEYGLRGMRGSVVTAGPDTFNFQHFQHYIGSRDLKKEFPGARGVGIIRRVPRDKAADFMERTRAEGMPTDFTLKELTPHDHPERFIIQYIAPWEANHQAAGLDVASEPNRYAAAMTSVQTNSAVLSRPLTVLQAQNIPGAAFLLLLPFYRPGLPLGTAQERWNATVGWAYMPLLMDDILRDLDFHDDNFELTLSTDDTHGKDQVFYQSSPSTSALPPVHHRTQQELFGRVLTAEFRATPHYVEQLNLTSPNRQGSIVLIAGLLGSVLVLILLLQAKRSSETRLVRERMARVVEDAGDAIVSKDLQGVITSWNPAAERIFGFRADEVLGRSTYERLIPDDKAREEQQMLCAIANQQAVPPFDTLRLHRDGHLIDVGVTVAPLHDEEGRVVGVATTMRDISERRFFIRQLETLVQERTIELSQAMEEASRANQAKSEFLTSMSHELRTPLNAILGFGQLLEADPTLNTDQRENTDEILKAARHLLSLINEVLDLAKIEAGRVELSLEPVEIKALAEECLALVQPMAVSQGIVVTANLARSTHVIADRVRMRQVLLNLLSNALKYNRKGGTVALTLHAPPEAGTVRLTVKDTGLGIPADMQPRIFEPFHRAGRENTGIEGTGVGLSITKQLVGFMGGSIGFTSHEGEGSTFWIELPAADAPETALQIAPSALATDHGQPTASHTLLCVDDNPANLRLITRILKPLAGVHVLSAPTPALGLELAQAHQPALILLDINMPDMDGYEVLRHIRSTPGLTTIPVVAVTANAMQRDIEHGMKAGFNAYVTKPLDVDHFLATVHRLLEPAPPR